MKTFVDFLQKKAKRRKSHTFTFDELKAYSVEGNFESLEISKIRFFFSFCILLSVLVGVAQDKNFRDFIETINTQGYFLNTKEGYKLLN